MLTPRFFAFCSAILAFSSPLAAQADILFINLNLSVKEYVALDKAANRLREPVIMVPDYSLAQLQALQLKAGDFNAIQSTINQDYQAKGRILDQVAAKLDELEKNGRSISSIVVSGHHNSVYFFGYGDRSLFTSPELADLIKNHPKLFSNLISIHFLACYGNTLDNATIWRSYFSSPTFFGFDSEAPGGDKDQSADLLSASILHRTAFSKAETSSEVNSLLKKFKRATHSENSGFSISTGKLFAGSQGAADLYFGTCSEKEIEIANQSYAVFEKYLYADEIGYEDVPENMNSSPLRSAYTTAQQYAHCNQLAVNSFRLPKMVNLVHFQILRQNFAMEFESEIKVVNSLLQNKGLAPIEDLTQKNITRHEMLVSIQQLKRFYFSVKEDGTSLWNPNTPHPLSWASIQTLKKLLYNMDEYLVECDTADPNWIIPQKDKKALEALNAPLDYLDYPSVIQ